VELGVPACVKSSQPGGVDHPVIGQRGCWQPVSISGGAEGLDHDRPGHSGVGGDV
jgi:hypothetical protein